MNEYATTFFKLFPWKCGVNTTDDLPLLAPNDLTIGDQIIIGTKGNPKLRDGMSSNYDDVVTTPGVAIIGGSQFFFGTPPRTDQRITVDVQGNIRLYTAGGINTLLSGGTAWTTPTRVSFSTINNLLIIAVDGDTNPPKQWDGTTLQDIGGSPPNFSISMLWQGRLMVNDKSDPDLLQYTAPFDTTQWQGVGDSGGIPIGLGDGDETGIVAIFPPFKGTLFVAKSTKLYQVSGDSPEDWDVELISNGIGCESHTSVVAVDQDDVFFVSRRGVHSLLATANFGDFTSTFVSHQIQKTIINNWIKNRLYACQGGFLPEINSVVFAVTDTTYSSNSNKALWFYNIGEKRWYSWSNIECDGLFVARDEDRHRLYLGKSNSRLTQTFNGNVYDVDETGATVGIPLNVKTGLLYLDGNPEIIKGMKRVGLTLSLTGITNITITVYIDNLVAAVYDVPNIVTGPLLGITFILGQSILGASTILTPFWLPIDGWGRSIQVQVQKSDTTSDLSLEGLHIEYEIGGPAQQMGNQ